MNLKKLSNIDSSWALFLDRDGVLNRRIEEGYVTKVSEMEILEGVTSALLTFSQIFKWIFIVTNQRGIAKGLYSIEELEKINDYLITKIKETGGRIDKIYFCPHEHGDHCECRKPGIGMALKAKQDFPEVDFKKSIMIGDSESDLEFGNRLGMKLIFLSPMVITKYKSLTFRCLFDASVYLKNFDRLSEI